MWSGPGQDPGGSAGAGPPNTQELNDLKDQFEQQQLLIAQLKEMLRKSEQTTVTQEKVEEYAHTLTKMKARAKRSTRKEGNKESNVKRLETPASEKISLLRQQLEENRLKLAERGKSQKGIEEMVTQLKAQLDDSQILMNQTPLNLSLSEIKQETYSVNSTSQELYNILVNKERRISEMTSRIHKLEANVLDLQENLKEKDSVIDARTKAITLMSENLSKKGKSTLDALDDTKLQMRKMQENFVELESQMKEENNRLANEVEHREHEISSLKQTVVYLEETKQELNVKMNELQEQLDSREVDITDRQLDVSADVEKLNLRIKELEMLNANLENTNDLTKSQDSIDTKELEELKKELDVSHKKITELEQSITAEQFKITEYISTVTSLEAQIKELTENKLLVNTEKSPVNLDIKLENEEITKLKKQLDESNKNMIKVKAQHKSKIKELNKKVDSFKKINDAGAEVVKLQDENAKLSQSIAELEEEKGALQLKIMETDSTKDSTNVELTNELEKKLSEQAELLSEKDNNIDQLTKHLEESSNQIEDLNEKLQKLTDLQNVQVKSEITSIQLEEQMDKLELEKQELIKEKETISQENLSLMEKLETFMKEKQEILAKLESYVQENIDLMDKLEKLSAEKVSSAESIEIVEGLTQQEKLELAAYQKSANISTNIKTSTEHLGENPELNESVNQLTEETSELLQKIELFTVERREVMEKMEQLAHENNQLNLKIKEIENNRDVLAETYEQLQNEKEQLDTNIENIKIENNSLVDKIKVLENENEELKKGTEKNNSDSDQERVVNLQNNIEEYQSLIEIQRQEIKELKVQLMGQEFVKTDKLELEAKVNSLQLQYQNILAENDSLVNKLKEQSEHVRQREDIEEELVAARKRVTEFEEKIAENIREIENYKAMLEDNKNELISSANQISELQGNISALKNEVTHYNAEVTHLNSVITDLNTAVDHLERENKENSANAENVGVMTNQLEELKQALMQNIEQIDEYQSELENNTVTISQLQKEIKALNVKILDTEHLLDFKNDELKSIQKEKQDKDNTIEHLNNEVKLKDENFHKIINDFKQRYHALQQQLEANTGSIDDMRQPLVNKILELEHKNKEQLEKMKIIAANLKKKTQALQNLEQKYTEVNEKWETEQKEKETLKEIAEKNVALEKEVEVLKERLDSSHNDFANQNHECQKLREELQDYNERSISLENMNAKLSEEISSHSVRLEDALNTINELESKLAEMVSENALIKTDRHNEFNHKLTEKEAIINNLSEELENLRYTSETSSNALQMKVQELEMFIETQDTDLTKYKDRVNKLEEGISFMEERRMSLERTAEELGAQLRQKTDECEEVTQTEDILEKRLSALMSHDEIIENKLQIMTNENEELHRHLKSVSAENNALNETIKQLKDLMNSAQMEKEALPMLESEISALKKTVNALEHDKKGMKNEYEQKIAIAKEDVEKMEVELQNQLELFDKDRRHFAEIHEKMSEQIKESLNQQEILSGEVVDYKQKLEEQSKMLLASSEACNKLQGEFQQTLLAFNELKEINKIHEDTILKLNEQILNSNIEIEKIELLRKQLQEKSDELETYQNESSQQRQIQNASGQPNQFDFASVFHVDNDLQNLKQINEDLHEQINTLHRDKENITFALSEVQRQLEESKTATASREEPQKSEELKSLKAQYNSLEMNYGKLTEENLSLQNHIINLTEQLQKINSGQDQSPSVFTWPGDEANTERKMINLDASTAGNIDNTKDELLNKIKSLEFMLHDVEKQKNDALIHCNTLSEELTKLVYLKKSQDKPVVEDKIIVKPSTSQFQDITLDFESQIVAADDAKVTPSDMAQLQIFEFSPTKDIVDFQSSQAQPVAEEAIKPKSAYLCYDPDDIEPGKPIDAFVENDDGWGWGPEEAKLEQEYLEKASSSPQSVQFMSQINSLEEKIKVLEQARERHLEDIKQSQLKSGKLIKKLKEFKTKNEELATQLNKKSDGFDDLNDAIQEELKSQIKNLEKKMKEVNAELEKERAEKSNVLKRVDTLTAAHDRMIENKEKQDVEIMSWQQRCRELNTKLEQFEWGSEESPKRVQNFESSENTGNETDKSERIEELTATIQELTLDNEELQALLEEQRNIRIAAEKAKSVEPIVENMKTEEEYLTVSKERDSLLKDLSSANEEMMQLKENLWRQLQSNEEFQRNIDALNLRNQQLAEEIKNSDKSQFIEDALQQINNLNIEKQKLIDDKTKNVHVVEELHAKLKDLQKEADELIGKERSTYEGSISELNGSLAALNNQISTLTIENDALQKRLNDFEKDKQAMMIEIDQKDAEKSELSNVITDLNMKLNNMDQRMLSMQNLNLEITEVNELLKKKEEELSGLTEKLSQQEAEYELKLSETVQQLHDEWNSKVDQRGYDVAESWKMHVDVRENEFLQIEEVLKKEIRELEEKHTTLVNENNELRRNVDAEIRNEVDRVSALQQQINDRQQYINDLSIIVQDLKMDIENQKGEIANLSMTVTELNKHIDTQNEQISSFEIVIKSKDDLLNEFNEKEAIFNSDRERMLHVESELKNLQDVLRSKDADLEDKENKLTQSSQKVEETSKLCEKLSAEVDEKVNIINDLSRKLQDSQSREQTANENVNILNQQCNEAQQQIANYHAHMQQQYLQIETLNQEVLKHGKVNEEFLLKDSELKRLTSLLEEKEREHSISLESKDQESTTIIKQNASEMDGLRRRLAAMESQYEELISNKDVDMQNLRILLDEQAKRNEVFLAEKEEFTHVQTELAIRTAECDELKSKIEEQNLIMDEESKQLGELREIIQDQVLKIDDLQKELYVKSSYYDALIAEVDLTHKSDSSAKPEKHVKFSDEVEVRNTPTASGAEDLSEPVSRAELDLALYMLHQRDVRCEELTVELMQLLEERDTLQLKLSNALREKELLRSKFDASSEESLNKSHSSAEFPAVAPALDASLTSEAAQELIKTSQTNPLDTKLSELKTVGYRKDKTLVDEQDLRRLQQLSIMQQHRDEAAKLPPEAAARLVDASYTLSRDVQSPSKVLLNWLWGRSTPKVNNV